MNHPTLRYFVTRPDESQASGGPSTHIPTYGHIASTVDVYRSVAVADVLHRPEAWCFTDTDAAAALGRVIDGPIQAKSDIEKAESALRAILLHDFVDIFVPCVKARYNSNFTGYARFDEGRRNEAAFAALNAAPCRDFLLAVEFVEVANGLVTGSSNPVSELVGKAMEDRQGNFNSVLSTAASVANALPMQVEAASYFACNEFVAAVKPTPAGFIDQLYRRIEAPWKQIAQSEPSLYIDLKLPPFIAIVLSRSPFRRDIPGILGALREELAGVRADLNRLNNMLDSVSSQADLNAQVRRVNESFDAIVAESLLTDTEQRLRRVKSVFSFVKPIRQIYSAAMDPLAADPDKLADIFNSTQQAVLRNSRIVSRSVSATKFAELLRVDSIRGLVTSNFSPEEIQLMAVS
jgi:hypothetical protein